MVLVASGWPIGVTCCQITPSGVDYVLFEALENNLTIPLCKYSPLHEMKEVDEPRGNVFGIAGGAAVIREGSRATCTGVCPRVQKRYGRRLLHGPSGNIKRILFDGSASPFGVPFGSFAVECLDTRLRMLFVDHNLHSALGKLFLVQQGGKAKNSEGILEIGLERQAAEARHNAQQIGGVKAVLLGQAECAKEVIFGGPELVVVDVQAMLRGQLEQKSETFGGFDVCVGKLDIRASGARHLDHIEEHVAGILVYMEDAYCLDSRRFDIPLTEDLGSDSKRHAIRRHQHKFTPIGGECLVMNWSSLDGDGHG